MQATWECYCELQWRYAEHGLDKSIDRILSEASLGKGCFQKMGIRPLLACHPKFPRKRFGEIKCAYYGGRAEVRNRREIHEVIYCDFKSMYPTVNTLMDLWPFVIAETITIHDSTRETRAFLKSLKPIDLQKPKTYLRLRTLVLVQPKDDVFPVRTDYDGESYTIGLNRFSSLKPLWFTLADCIVSKLLTGRCPEILKAQTYCPGKPQKDLKAIDLLGRPDFRIDPLEDDLFRRLIDLRDEAKENGDEIEQTIKIIANSSSYGIFIEVNRNDTEKAALLHVYGPDGKLRKVRSKSTEEPGRYFNPILGVLITGAARLMLGIAERLALDAGLDWAFCDTDSFAFIRPKNIPVMSFASECKRSSIGSSPQPYRKPGSILKIEDVNYGIDSKGIKPLYCFAISAKRYALFNFDRDGKPVLRKASAHGLGHLIDPYNEADAPPNLPQPKVPLRKLGVKRWHHDLWIRILQAAIDGKPDQVAIDWHPAFLQPAAMRYAATSPALLAWFKQHNGGKPYADRVGPFVFLLAYMPRTGLVAKPPPIDPASTRKRGRPRNTPATKPIAPYNSDPRRALSKVFDRQTGRRVGAHELKTYAEVLSQYHLSPEAKFSNARHLDRGRTERRRVLGQRLF